MTLFEILQDEIVKSLEAGEVIPTVMTFDDEMFDNMATHPYEGVTTVTASRQNVFWMRIGDTTFEIRREGYQEDPTVH